MSSLFTKVAWVEGCGTPKTGPSTYKSVERGSVLSLNLWRFAHFPTPTGKGYREVEWDFVKWRSLAWGMQRRRSNYLIKEHWNNRKWDIKIQSPMTWYIRFYQPIQYSWVWEKRKVASKEERHNHTGLEPPKGVLLWGCGVSRRSAEVT